MTQPVVLTIDQGTTSTRVFAVTQSGLIVASAQIELEQHYPKQGWVEHDADQIWQDALICLHKVISKIGTDYTLAAIGITNQRETTVMWDRTTGKPIHNAIVWQDRRTAAVCNRLKAQGCEAVISSKTGLLLDPYFSASKISWLLDNVQGARDAATRGEIAFGTIETYLLWQLTKGSVHCSDETNAARTSLWNIHSEAWDDALLELFNVPSSVLPDVKPSAARFGVTEKSILGVEIPITGMAGDQQAASFGQLCLAEGQMKATYGTGCFALLNTGAEAVMSENKLLTTRACRLGSEAQFALEGSIFMAGAISQWLRDRMGLISSAGETEKLATSVNSSGGVYLVPAFTGLGTPYWDSEVQAAIFGMTRQTGRAEIVRAGMEAVAFQTVDLIKAFSSDAIAPTIMRVDGGMSANSWLMQTIADMTGIQLERPENLETTAMGAAFLAGLTAGVWNDVEDLQGLSGQLAKFQPAEQKSDYETALAGWHRAIKATQYFSKL